MSPKPVRTKEIERIRASIYLQKAGEFFTSMKTAKENGDWDACGLNGIHCAISASDALLVNKAGIRSRGESHTDVVSLLEEKIKTPELKEQTRRLVHILNKKNLVEYEDRQFTASEADALEKDVERYFSWVKKQIAS